MRRVFTAANPGILLIGAVLFLSAAGSALNFYRQPQPARLFWNAFEAGMTTTGVTCSTQKTSGNTTTRQEVSLDLASKSRARLVTRLANATTAVTTDNIVTKTDSYIRYTVLESTAKAPLNKTLDFSNVRNVWARQPYSSDDALPVFDRTALGGCIVPLGNLTSQQAKTLLSEAQKSNIFTVDFDKTQWQWHWQEPTRSYKVTINSANYVLFMQRFADSYGLQGLQHVDTAKFSAQSPRHVVLTVGTSSEQVRAVRSDSPEVHVDITHYGVIPVTTQPTHVISIQELEKRLRTTQH